MPPPAQGRHGDPLVFHYADDANRVQDILTGLALCRLAVAGYHRPRD